jgi:hypothetical protein
MNKGSCEVGIPGLDDDNGGNRNYLSDHRLLQLSVLS